MRYVWLFKKNKTSEKRNGAGNRGQRTEQNPLGLLRSHGDVMCRGLEKLTSFSIVKYFETSIPRLRVVCRCHSLSFQMRFVLSFRPLGLRAAAGEHVPVAECRICSASSLGQQAASAERAALGHSRGLRPSHSVLTAASRSELGPVRLGNGSSLISGRGF